MSKESEKTTNLYLFMKVRRPAARRAAIKTRVKEACVCLSPEDAAVADIMSFVCFSVNSTDATVGEVLSFGTCRRTCFVVVVVVFIGLYRSAG